MPVVIMLHRRAMELLRVTGLTKRYDGACALRDAWFEVQAGEVHALMGENGAGKSTLAKIVAGAVKADEGEICFRGEPVSIHGPLEAQRLGIGIIFPELDLFPNLTLGENIVIGTLKTGSGRFVRFGEVERFCRPFLEQVGLGSD